MNTMIQSRLATSALLLVMAAGALAQEQKAYRHVDAAGNVTYSQTPPADGKTAKQVNIAPAQQGRGGYVGGYSTYDNPRYYADRSSERYQSYQSAMQYRQSAQEQRIAGVKAECERQRGADCSNPATIQYLDSTSIPRRGRYR